jgi:hypothetical protein
MWPFAQPAGNAQVVLIVVGVVSVFWPELLPLVAASLALLLQIRRA